MKAVTQSRAHPWHGVAIGERAPDEVNVYIEIVPTDSVKYELDKDSGLLIVDRPQKFSNHCPALYGFVPRTLCKDHICAYANEKLDRRDLVGDNDPLDICVMAERTVVRGDILLRAIPIGGFRMIDNGEADDKIIAVLKGDLGYGHIRHLEDLPSSYIARLRHYFLTYKNLPLEGEIPTTEIPSLYGREEAHEVIRLAQKDYEEAFLTGT